MLQSEKDISADLTESVRIVNEAAAGYAELRRRMQAAELFERRPASYAFRTTATVAILAVGLIGIVVTHGLWAGAADVVLLSFIYTQIAFLVHDAGHGQIVKPGRLSNLLGLFYCDLLLGASFSWWVQKHNRHHRSPNELGKDPDVSISTLAFTPEQARQKKGLLKLIVRFQAYLFVPMILIEGIAVRISSIVHLINRRDRASLVETLLISTHFVVYFGLVFSQMSLLGGLVFVLAHQMLFGLYMGSVFAPNHKGMPVFGPSTERDFLYHQVLTARNVKGSPLVDFWYGCLNYQIEHHLFPIVPRENLKAAQRIVSYFCRERGIPYRQDGMLQSYKEVFSYLNQIGSSLSARKIRPMYDTLSSNPEEGLS